MHKFDGLCVVVGTEIYTHTYTYTQTMTWIKYSKDVHEQYNKFSKILSAECEQEENIFVLYVQCIHCCFSSGHPNASRTKNIKHIKFRNQIRSVKLLTLPQGRFLFKFVSLFGSKWFSNMFTCFACCSFRSNHRTFTVQFCRKRWYALNFRSYSAGCIVLFVFVSFFVFALVQMDRAFSC